MTTETVNEQRTGQIVGQRVRVRHITGKTFVAKGRIVAWAAGISTPTAIIEADGGRFICVTIDRLEVQA